MNHMRLKAAVAKYAGEDLKPTQLLEALKVDEKAYTPEEIDEIFDAVLLEKNPKAELRETEPAEPYIICDIWHGTWEATEWMRNPLTGGQAPIKFNFVKQGKVKREKVKVEPRRMGALNSASHINITGVVIEQFIPAGHKGNWGYERKVENGIPQ